jgi:adenosylcobinamide kinase/adenosylcobinamide-phosphate guanylyltransferase
LIHLVLGGARSGKSSFAEKEALALAKEQNKEAVYIATATAIDDEMVKRITKHQQDRSKSFQLIESPVALCDTLEKTNSDNVFLLDCLTLWLNNVIFFGEKDAVIEDKESDLKEQINQLINTLRDKFSEESCNIIIVSNEVGLGVIPMGESTRLFVDYCGWLNQGIAKISQKVTLVTAGIPLTLKPNHSNK